MQRSLTTRVVTGLPLVRGVWGTPYQCEHISNIRFKLSGLDFDQPCRVAPLLSFDVILGMDWINKHAVSNDWGSGTWILQDKKKSRATFDPTRIAIPTSTIHTLNVVAEVLIDEQPLSKGGMRRFL